MAEETVAVSKAKIMMWLKVVGAVVVAIQSTLSMVQVSGSADAGAVKEIAKATDAKGEAALIKATVNESNIDQCFEGLATLRQEMNDKSLKFAELIVQLSQNSNHSFKDVHVPVQRPSRQVRVGAGPAPEVPEESPDTELAIEELSPKAAVLQQMLNAITATTDEPAIEKQEAPEFEAPAPGELQKLYEKL